MGRYYLFTSSCFLKCVVDLFVSKCIEPLNCPEVHFLFGNVQVISAMKSPFVCGLIVAKTTGTSRVLTAFAPQQGSDIPPHSGDVGHILGLGLYDKFF